MTLFPQQPVMRLVATAWLLASVVLLTLTLLRPDITGNSRGALVLLTPLYWLAFPLGHLGVMAGIELRLRLYLELNLVPSVLAEGLYLWTALTVLGYAQWFVLVPLLARKLRQVSGFLSKRTPAR